MEQNQFQLTWPEPELRRLANKVDQDYKSAITDHNRRIARWSEYYRRWRGIVPPPAMGEEDKSNMPVPYIEWNILTKWAKEMDSLFGDDAEIVAVPVGPGDVRRDKKIGRYMTWRVFNSMRLMSRLSEFVLRKLIFGRSFAYSPWTKEEYKVHGSDKIKYQGPEFEPIAPDDLIVPAERVRSLHEFSYVVRRYRTTPDKLLAGAGKAYNKKIIDERWQDLINLAQHGRQVSPEGEPIRREQDDDEGLIYERPQSAGEIIEVLEWYGRWRPLKGKTDGGVYNFKVREREQGEYVVRYIRDLNLIVGLQDLAELYPEASDRRPFVEASMMKDGSYWCRGMAQQLLNLEQDLTANHSQGTEAGQLACSPMLAYRPGSGMNPETFKVGPGLTIALDNPQTDARLLTFTANLEACTWKEQAVIAYGEKLTGLSDLQMGRQSDRPNAPRTARQTAALLEEGNVRISLDTKMLAEDMAGILKHLWELECQFTTEERFFRVTEEDADGLFDVDKQKGGSFITEDDFDTGYDFRIKFANSVWSKEANKEKSLARYQLDLQNPLIVSNPRALWQVTRDAHEALGDPNFQNLVPEPPAPDISIDPREEWVRIEQGEEVHVNPMDNDQVHMIRHYKDILTAQADPETDPKTVQELVDHYKLHIIQLQQKKLQQAVIEQGVRAAAQLAQPGGPLQFMNGLFGNAPSQPEGNPAAQGPNIYSGHNEVMHES